MNFMSWSRSPVHVVFAMILSQTTMIAAPAERIFAFFDRMEVNYTR